MSEWTTQQGCWSAMKGRTLSYNDDFDTSLTLDYMATTAKRNENSKVSHDRRHQHTIGDCSVEV